MSKYNMGSESINTRLLVRDQWILLQDKLIFRLFAGVKSWKPPLQLAPTPTLYGHVSHNFMGNLQDLSGLFNMVHQYEQVEILEKYQKYRNILPS